jgi:flagellar biosynthesis protein FlhF
MFVKRFLANDMQEAIRKISREFGPDAVIIENKSVRRKGIAGLFKKKMVEVVAAYEPNRFGRQEAGQQSAGQPANAQKTTNNSACSAARSVETPKGAQLGLLDGQVKELKDAVQEFTSKLRVAGRETALTFSSDVLGLYNQLLERDVQEELCKEIAAQTQSIKSRRDVDARTIGEQLVCDMLGQAMPLKLKKYERNVLLFTGPTGAGKTTTLAKLAGTLKFREHLDVGFINTDTYRVGAMEHIRIYADIMDIPLVTAYNAGEIERALKKLSDKDVVLIDTAGRNVRDDSSRNELKQLVAATHADEVFLVISVVTGAKACRDVIENYAFLDDYKLIITKLDEAAVWGNVLNIADFSKKELTYVTVGQNVPEDIREVNTQWLASNILGNEVILI